MSLPRESSPIVVPWPDGTVGAHPALNVRIWIADDGTGDVQIEQGGDFVTWPLAHWPAFLEALTRFGDGSAQ